MTLIRSSPSEAFLTPALVEMVLDLCMIAYITGKNRQKGVVKASCAQHPSLFCGREHEQIVRPSKPRLQIDPVGGRDSVAATGGFHQDLRRAVCSRREIFKFYFSEVRRT